MHTTNIFIHLISSYLIIFIMEKEQDCLVLFFVFIVSFAKNEINY